MEFQHLINAAIGALSNRIRGGLLKDLGFDISGKTLNIIVFSLLFGFMTGAWTLAPLAALGMWGGQSIGWGVPVGRLGGWEKEKWEEEPYVLDRICEPLKPYPKLYGFVWLTLRGVLWGGLITTTVFCLPWLYNFICGFFSLSLPLITLLDFSWYYLLGGSTMGLAFALGLHTPVKNRWGLSEWIYGAMFWGLCYVN